MPSHNIRHTVVVCTELNIILKISARRSPTIFRIVGPCNFCIGISSFDNFVITLPCFKKVSFNRTALIDRDIDNRLVDINSGSNVIFWSLGSTVLLLSGFFPGYNARAYILFQVAAILLNGRSRVHYTVIIAVVHLNLLAAALQESLSDV